MDIAAALAFLGGTASRASLLAHGATDRELAVAVATGQCAQPRRGWYSLPSADLTASMATAWSATPACLSALQHWNLPAPQPTAVHLAVSSNSSLSARGPRNGCVFHHYAEPCGVRPIDAIDTAVRCLDRVEQLIAVDAALNRGLIRTDFALDMTATSMSRRTWLREHCGPTSQSPLETRCRLGLNATGYSVESQVHVEGVGRVDFVVDGRVIVEVDGQAYHSAAPSFREDRRRDRAASLSGWVVLRFTWADVLGDRAELTRQVRAAVRMARARDRATKG